MIVIKAAKLRKHFVLKMQSINFYLKTWSISTACTYKLTVERLYSKIEIATGYQYHSAAVNIFYFRFVYAHQITY